MGRDWRRFDVVLVMAMLASLFAWTALALDGGGLMLPAFCSTGAPWAVPLSAWLQLAFASVSLSNLAFGAALMLAAMMSPFVIEPVRYVRDRSFARRRGCAMILFVAGYATVWMMTAVALQALALVVIWAIPAPLVRVGVASALCVAWQFSPAKQWFLNRCHRRAHLSAFGIAAERDAFAFGLSNGASCVGTCWALMLLQLVVGNGHIFLTIAVMLFAFAERLERPAPLAWRCRGPGKAVRIGHAILRAGLARVRGRT